MPFKNLRVLTSNEIEELIINELKDDVDTGYIFEVDLDYPEHLHDLHNDLPVAPVQRKFSGASYLHTLKHWPAI